MAHHTCHCCTNIIWATLLHYYCISVILGNYAISSNNRGSSYVAKQWPCHVYCLATSKGMADRQGWAHKIFIIFIAHARAWGILNNQTRYFQKLSRKLCTLLWHSVYSPWLAPTAPWHLHQLLPGCSAFHSSHRPRTSQSGTSWYMSAEGHMLLHSCEACQYKLQITTHQQKMIPGPGACLQKLKGKLPMIHHNMICKYLILINNMRLNSWQIFRETENRYMPWTMIRKFAYVEHPLRKNLYNWHGRQLVRIRNQSIIKRKFKVEKIKLQST